MKYLMIVLCVLLLTTCKKDESKTEKSIIGTWKSVSFTISEPTDLNSDGVKNTDYTKEIKGCYEYIFDFLENGNFHLEIKFSPIGEYGKYLDVTECESQLLNGTWELNESSTKLYIQFTEGFSDNSSLNPLKSPISTNIELTNTQLVIQEFPQEYWFKLLYKIQLSKN